MNRNDLLKSGIKRMTQILLSLLMVSVALLGQSKSTFIKQFEYDDENGQWGNPIVVNDSILIVAYSGYKGFGNVQTLKIAADGSTISKVALLRFDDDDAYEISVEKVANDMFVVAYRGRSQDGFLTTIKVSGDGQTLTQVKKLEHDTANGRNNALRKVDSDTYALSYIGTNGSGALKHRIKTFTIPADGSNITEVAVLDLNTSYIVGNSADIIEAAANMFVVASSSNNNITLKTVSISNDGATITEKTSQNIPSSGKQFSLAKMTSNLYILEFYGNHKGPTSNSSSNGGVVASIDIPADGSSITPLTYLRHSSTSGFDQNTVIKIDNNTFASAFKTSKGILRTFNMSNDGRTLTSVGYVNFFNSATKFNNIIQWKNNVYLITYAGTSDRGYINTYKIESDKPYINSYILAADNSIVKVTFNEAVYNATGGSGALEASDFTIAMTGGKASLTSATPTGISVSGNEYTLKIPYDYADDYPNGQESITVNVASNAIYDANDNVVPAQTIYDAISTSSDPTTIVQRNIKTLSDKELPYFTSVTSELDEDNTPIQVTFNEEVFNTNGGSGALEASDFTLRVVEKTEETVVSFTDASATTGWTNAWQSFTTVKKGSLNKISLRLQNTSSVDGYRMALYLYNNDSNSSSANPNDKFSSPISRSQLTIVPKNSNGEIHFIFPQGIPLGASAKYFFWLKNEGVNPSGAGKVYVNSSHNDGGAGNNATRLFHKVTMFTGEGSGTLVSATPSSISKSSNTYTLEVNWDLVPNGKEKLVVQPASGAIFDAKGNIATTVQAQNRVTVNDYRIVSVSDLQYYNGSNYWTNNLALGDDLVLTQHRDYLYLNQIAKDGKTKTQKSKLYHQPNEQNRDTDLIRVSRNLFITSGVTYDWGASLTYGNIIKSITVSKNNQMMVVDTYKPDNINSSSYGAGSSLLQLNDSVFVSAYQGNGYDGYIHTFKMDEMGYFTKLQMLEHYNGDVGKNLLQKIDANTVLLLYHRGTASGQGHLTTFDISADGKTITEVKEISLSSNVRFPSMAKRAENAFVAAYTGPGNDGFISTIATTADGNTITIKKTVEHDTDNGQYNSMLGPIDGNFGLAYTGPGNDGFIKIFNIPNDDTITEVINVEHDRNQSNYNSVFIHDWDTYGITHQDRYGRGNISILEVNNKLPLNPGISAVSVNVANSELSVTFNEAVFNTTGGSGALEVSDFSLTMEGGTAKLSSATPTSISSSGNTYTLAFGITGTPDGYERITVRPSAANAIYDANDNPVKITSADLYATYLYDKRIPIITSVNNIYNEYLEVDFSEPVYGGTNGNEVIVTSDFVLSSTGGTATVNANPTSVTGFGQYGKDTAVGSKYRLYFSFSGTPDGNEEITLSVKANSIFDANLNPVATSQPKAKADLFRSRLLSVGSMEYNTSEGRDASVVHVENDVYAMAYSGPGQDGFIQTFNMSKNGNTIQKIAEYEHDTNKGDMHQIIRHNENIFIVVYRDADDDGFLKTFNISANGNTISEIAKLEYNTASARYPSIKRVDHDSYILAYTYSNNKGYLQTFDISADGNTITKVSEYRHENNWMGNNTLLQLSPNYFVLSNRGVRNHSGGDFKYGHWIKTYNVSDDGTTITPINSLNHASTFTSNYGYYNHFAKLDSDSYALMTRSNTSQETGGEWKGILKTFTIAPDGSSIQQESVQKFFNEEFNGEDGYQNHLLLVNSDNLMIKSRDRHLDGWIKNFKISNNGSTLTEDWKFEFETNRYRSLNNQDDELFLVDNNTLGITYSDASYDGQIRAIDMILTDVQKPIITSTKLSKDNAILIVDFNEPTFKDANGNGFLEKTDFELTLTGGAATLSSKTPIKIVRDGNMYLLTVSYNGVADGNEVVTVKPVADAIFDGGGNKAETSQSNNTVTLNEKTLPNIASTALSGDNKTLTVTFSEEVFDQVTGSGALETGDFVLSVTGGVATLTNATPLAISSLGSNAYALTIGYQGMANGTEVISVTPSANAIFDRAGNIANTSQSNNQLSLNEVKIQQITSAEHNTTNGTWNSLIRVDDDTYALAYSANSSHGNVKTFSISNDGLSISTVQNIQYQNSSSLYNDFVQIDNNTFAVAYSGPGNDGYIRTMDISGSGAISLKSVLEFETGQARWNSIVQVKGSVYAVAYTGPGNDGYIRTLNIAENSGSTTIANLAVNEHHTEDADHHDLVNLNDSTLALAYRATRSGSRFLTLKTFSISSDGKTITEKKKTELAFEGLWPSIAIVDNNTFIMAYQKTGGKGEITTFDYAADGSSITQVHSFEFDAGTSRHHSLVNSGSNTFTLASNTNYSKSYMRMFTVPTDGKTITLTYATTFDNNQNNSTGTYYSLARVDSDTYALAHTGTNNDGYIKTFQVIAGDKVLPVISYVNLNDNNATIDVTFNENVFSSAGASGILDINDFVLTLSGGSAELASATPTNITNTNKTYTLAFTLNGSPDGSETLTVSPANNAIYDAGGNIANSTQSNNTLNLNDKSGPKISSTLLAANNASIILTLNESSFNTSSGSGKLEKEDFVLSLSGGDANLVSTTPTSISDSATVYTLGFSITGSPNGSEVLTIKPAVNAIYDSKGNVSSTVQLNNSVNLKDIVPPVIDSVRVSSDNDVALIYFNEKVASKSDGTGALDSADFVFSISGGTAKLAKSYPASISASDNVISLGIFLNGTPNGSETLSLSPVDSSIYDLRGNLANASQTNNTVKLFDKVLPFITKSSLLPSNDSISITFNENIFAKSDASGTIDTSDFAFMLSEGAATLQKNYPSGIRKDGNTYHLALNLKGVPDGKEKLVINPNANSVFDASGNKASTSQSNNNQTLYDKAPPEISNISLASDNNALTVTFNEAVFSNSDGTGDIEKSDFVMALTGGRATLASPFPTSLSKSGNTYSLGIGLNGEPNGSEELTLLIVDRAVFDAGGNSAVSNQTKSKVTLNDKNAPIITKLLLSENNESVEITFNEKIFGTIDGNTAIDSSVFNLSISGGSAKLTQADPNKLTAKDSVTYTISLPLSGIPDGSETVTISLEKESVYDASGSEAATTQAINKVTLNDLSAPLIVSTKLNSDNSKITVVFNVSVYGTTKNTGDLETDDFELSIAGGSATLKNSTPTTISSSNSAKQYELTFELSGEADGTEKLTVKPVSNGIFDSAANAASKTQTDNTVNLFDKRAPLISSTSLNTSNDTLTLVFNEAVSSGDASDPTIKNEGFVLSITGGLATLTSPYPKEIIVSGNTYKLLPSITGTPDGNELLTVTASNGSIFDASGNDASVKKQSNNSVYLFDQKAPKAPTGLYTITGNERITLSWKTSDEKDIDKYYIFQGTSPSSTSKIDSVGFGINTLGISSLTNGTRYYFKVSALDKTGYESVKSDTASGIPSTTMSYTVKSDGTGDFTSAQDAIEKAVNGDTVFIATGVYDSIRVDSKTINIIAGDGPANSIIDAKGKTTAVKLLGFPNQTTISGFTIKGGIGDNNANGLGGGIRVEAGVDAKIENCIVTDNKDGALYFADSSSTTISNVLVYGNDQTFNIGSGSVTFLNCTFSEQEKDATATTGSKMNFINTIFMDQVSTEDSVMNAELFADHSLFTYGDNTFNSNHYGAFNYGTNNLVDDPLFADTLNNDYHLNRKSPAIGFGTLSLAVGGATYKAPEKDLDLNARPGPSGSAPDLGAFESPYSSSLPRANNISDGLSDTLELDFTNSSTTLSARWKSFGSGITYDYAIGTGNLKNNIVDWTTNSTDTSAIVTLSGAGQLQNSTTYFFSVRGSNEQGSVTITTDGVFVDLEDPKISSVTEFKTDLDWFGPTIDGHIFANASDNGGITKYEFSIGSSAGLDDIIPWVVSDSNSYLADVSSLSEDFTYYSNARVTDVVGNVVTQSSDGFKMDITNPILGNISIGNEYQSDTSKVTYVWSDFDDLHSGIADYQYSLGTESGLTDVIPRTSFGLNADFASVSITIGGLSLQNEQTYYGTIYAVDKVGNETLAFSEGMTIDRNGPDAGQIVDGFGPDLDFLKDTTSATASWSGFYDLNRIDYYELTLGSSEGKTDIVDWTDVGTSSSYSFNGLSLKPGSSYYFSIRAFDRLGNPSQTISTDGFLIDMVGPNVLGVSVPTDKILAIYEPISIDVFLSEIAKSAEVEFRTERANIFNLEPDYKVNGDTVNVTFKPPFTSGDKITFTISVIDVAGNETRDLSYTYTIALLSDFDEDGEIGLGDIYGLVTAWNEKDYSKELAPVTGSAPYFTPAPDGVFDVRDGMAFVRMWQWSNNSSNRMLARRGSFHSGASLDVDVENDHLLITPPKSVRAVELIANYAPYDIALTMSDENVVSSDAISLVSSDTLSGSLLIHTARYDQTADPIRIDVKHLQKEMDVPVTLSYRYLGVNGEEIAAGSETIEIVPVPTDFALHNNYPNPFNPTTSIDFDLPEDGNVVLMIYDVMGREVATLQNSEMKAGYHSVRWDARNQMGRKVAAGVYLYQIKTDRYLKTRKMVLLK